MMLTTQNMKKGLLEILLHLWQGFSLLFNNGRIPVISFYATSNKASTIIIDPTLFLTQSGPLCFHEIETKLCVIIKTHLYNKSSMKNKKNLNQIMEHFYNYLSFKC